MDPDLASKLASTRKFYLDNFYHFARDICGYRDLQPVPHLSVADFLVNTPGNGSKRISNSNYNFKVRHLNIKAEMRRVAIFEPRNTFKSSVIAKAYPVWRLMNNPYLHILLVAYSDKKAVSVLKEIEGLFHRPDLVDLFGDFCPKGQVSTKEKYTWNESELQLWDAYNEQLVPFSSNMGNLKAVGLGTDIVSLHCDLAIADDIVCVENSGTKDARDKVKAYMAYLGPIVNPGGEIIINGTRYDDDDYYGEVIRDDTYDIRLMKCHNADGTLYFPQRLTEPFLADARQNQGEYVFACQYDNDPINTKNQTFKEDWLSHCIAGYKANPPKREELRVMSYIDPAFAKTKRSNRTALMTGGINHAGQIWITDEAVGKWTDDEVVEKTYEQKHRWNPDAVGIEANAAQGLFGKIFQLEGEKRKERITIRPVEHSTRIDKSARIRSLMPYIERTQIYINPECVNLISELRRFNRDSKSEDDCPDALEGLKSMLNPPELKIERSPEMIKQQAIDRSMRDEGYEKRVLNPSFTDTYGEVFS